MKRLNDSKFITVLIVFTAVIVLGGKSAHAQFTFGQPVNDDTVEPFLSDPNSLVNCFRSDGLEMFIESEIAGGQGGADIWVRKRASSEDDWDPLENLGPMVNSASWEYCSSITGDGLELYFVSDRPGGYDSYDLYVTKRVTQDSPWGPAANLGSPASSSYWEVFPSVSSDGLELYFMSYNRPGGYGGMDIWVSKRATRQDP